MDLHKLFHAVTVAREGSFAAAAKAIPLSQSALTRSIQALEHYYAIRLFERGKNGVRLTPDGVAFIAIAEEILWGAERADERLTAIAIGQSATVRFGAGPVMTAHILPKVLPRLMTAQVKYHIRTGSDASLRSLLSQGEIDFFIGGVPQHADHFSTALGFRLDPVLATKGSIELFVRPGHPLELAALCAENLVKYPVVCESFARDQLGVDGFKIAGLQQPSLEIDDYHVLTELVCATDSILVANQAVQDFQLTRGIALRSIGAVKLPRKWNWVVMSSSRAPLSAAASAVVEVFREHISQLAIERTRAAGSA